MNAGPDVERLISGWLHEEAPGRAPDRILEAAARTIDRTHQRRFAAAWRPRTMFDRLAVAAVSAVLVLGALTLGASLINQPDNAAPPCPRTFSEADAIDTFAPGLSQAQRAWGTAAGSSRVRAGYIAGFAETPPDDDPGTVILLDPATGTRCRLIQLASQHPIAVPITSLDWSPSGDALAIALAGFEPPDGSGAEDGVVLVWTQERLLRIWKGEGSPRLEWAPDGRSLVVWASDGTMGPDGVPERFDTRLIFANGTPDRAFDVFPVDGSLRWSPDGSRWAVAEAIEPGLVPDAAVSIVAVADGRRMPVDVGTGFHRPIWWSSNDSVVIRTIERERGVVSVSDVPIVDPAGARAFGPGEAPSHNAILSPDGMTFLDVVVDSEDGGFGDLRVSPVGTEGLGPALRLAPGLEVGEVGFAWSPDGSQVVFHALDEGLWTVNVDGSGLRQVATGGIVIVDDPWQPVPLR